MHIEQNSASMVMDAVVCHLAGVKTIIGHSHNTFCNVVWQHKLLRPFTNITIPYKFACSNEAGKWIWGNNPNVVIIKNAINPLQFRYQESHNIELRNELGLQNKRIIGFVGRLHSQKNPFRLIDIFEEVYNNTHDTHLLIVGDGEEREKMEDYIKGKNSQDAVTFTGKRADVNRIYSVFDLLLMPSLYEGQPVVCIEAQASGCPSVLSENVPCEAMNQNVVKISLDENNEDWAKKIIFLLDNDFDRSNAYQNLANFGYDIRLEAKKLESFYLSHS